ncbi:SRPBCC family protein [Pelagibacterium montanilacus]|uniref:SRPBCC family protein n=1 Tax=Pelagibacterium montanilacus TaxID=2185280 RepID=UPI000F8EE6F1|nr:SRPBCC domain-containing protein [Pelagibacterium montanilacus]
MAVKKEPNGRRSVQTEVEVPGTPETVWEAIASGPGISAWFVPAEVDGRVGGTTVCHFAPGGSMDSVARITEWQPPYRFVAETEEGPGIVATEWSVEARAGGVCTVRVVHSWVAEGDDWDNEFEGHSWGWMSFFKILRFYLEYFPGEESMLVQLAARSEASVAETFSRLMGPLGVSADTDAQRVRSGEDAPALAGDLLEVQSGKEGFSVLVRVDDPARAIVHMIGIPMGRAMHVSVRFYLYGAEAIGKAGRIEAEWQGWLNERFGAA